MNDKILSRRGRREEERNENERENWQELRSGTVRKKKEKTNG